MAENHTISALIAKRAEVMGLLEKKQKEINSLRKKITSLDEAIIVLDEDFDIKSIRSRRFREKNKYFEHGESSRLILDFLRTSEIGYEFDVILDHIMKIKFFPKEEANSVSKSLKGTLVQLKSSKKVKQTGLWYEIAY